MDAIHITIYKTKQKKSFFNYRSIPIGNAS